jgi:phosphotransferase system enzyme I (PtsI)
MAGDPRCIPALLSCGLRELSVNPSALAQIKQAIDTLSPGVACD